MFAFHSLFRMAASVFFLPCCPRTQSPLLRKQPMLEAARQTRRFLYRGETLSPRDGAGGGGPRAVIETPDLLDKGWCQACLRAIRMF